MSSYVIGDVHGCFEELTKLLDLINYDSNKDKLLFTGDLVNGAPKSVATLEFIKSLGDKAITVLGNHDLTLLALASGNLQQYKLNTSGFDEVLNHEKKQELIEWLRSRPLVHYEKDFNALLIHAGLYPFWSIQKVCSLAEEVEKILASDDCTQLFANMFGNLPDKWNDNLEGWERIRFTINVV